MNEALALNNDKLVVNRADAMKTTLPKIAFALLAGGIGLSGFFAAVGWREAHRPPDEVALAYARAVYARDYAAAWEFISTADKQYKTREQFLTDNALFSGVERDLAYTLAGWIRFTETQVETFGADRVTITTHVKAPNGNQPEVYDILQAAEHESELTDAERQALFDRLQTMYAAGQIEIVEGDQTFLLAREQDSFIPWFGLTKWGVVMDWAGAIVVKLTAEVSPDLPWEFYPLQAEVRALPGATLTATYRVTNRSDRTITAKAKHFILPEEYKDHFTSIQCFCFIQQTLDPGETEDMTLIFRIDYDVPSEVRMFENKYVFYPIETFPKD